MAGKGNPKGTNRGGGKPPRPGGAKRINAYLSNGVIDYLQRNGTSQTIERLAREKMEQQARERINEMGFTQEQQDFIWSDWPNWNEHIEWLLTASREEILEWIEAGQ